MPRTTPTPESARRRIAPLALLSAALLLAPAVALPGAVALGGSLPPIGTSTGDIAALTAAGAAPGYASYWVGDWMADSGWGGFDKAMLTAKAAGVTPVVYWYYWGDSISPSCVENGCDGRNRAEWISLTHQLAAHLNSTLKGSEVVIVLENEFNKGGITDDSYASKFDARLEGVAKTLNTVPNAKIVIGFGAWGEHNWAKFPKTIEQSDYIGFQMMRASTKDSEASYRGAAERTVYLTNYIAAKFDKPSFLYDLALSSYPDAKWAKIQAETLDSIFSKLEASGAVGLQAVVYRSLSDHYMSPANYYGYAESHWGLRLKDGTPKPAFAVWLEHSRSAINIEAPAVPVKVVSNTTISTTKGVITVNENATAAPMKATFSNAKGNDWWVQVSVSADRSISSVSASVNGGAWKQLDRKSYGYAASFFVPNIAKVVFKATATDGSMATSATYSWPSATIVSTATATVTATTSTTTTTSTQAPTTASATFTPYDGNTYWVQTKVASKQTVKSVCASLDGGTCKPLSKRSWGAWAAEMPAPSGTKVVFKATLGDGSVVRSSTYTWPVN